MKYELVHEDTKIVDGVKLTRIRALIDVRADVEAGALGGYMRVW